MLRVDRTSPLEDTVRETLRERLGVLTESGTQAGRTPSLLRTRIGTGVNTKVTVYPNDLTTGEGVPVDEGVLSRTRKTVDPKVTVVSLTRVDVCESLQLT